MEKHNKLAQAIEMATWAHMRQWDWAGWPYIMHPMRVMLAVMRHTKDEDVLCAAVLHDVVEDTQITVKIIRDNFGDEVARLVRALSRYPGGELYVPDDNGPREAAEEPYPDFIERVIRAGANARLIKETDIIDNMNRLPLIMAVDPAKAERLRLKYRAAMDRLDKERYKNLVKGTETDNAKREGIY